MRKRLRSFKVWVAVDEEGRPIMPPASSGAWWRKMSAEAFGRGEAVVPATLTLAPKRKPKRRKAT